MLRQLLALLQPQTNKDTLADLLSTKQGQEELLGVAAAKLPTPAAILADINHVLSYSTSADYQIWAREVWSNILNDLDKLLNPKATKEEIDFYRGRVSQGLTTLRISHRARFNEDQMRKQAQFTAKAARS